MLLEKACFRVADYPELSSKSLDMKANRTEGESVGLLFVLQLLGRARAGGEEWGGRGRLPGMAPRRCCIHPGLRSTPQPLERCLAVGGHIL